MNIPKQEDLNCSTCTARSLKVHYPEFLQHLEETYPDLTHAERLYWFYNNISKRPTCKVCGKETSFINWRTGYREFCGYTCMNSCSDIQDRKKSTSQKNWGCDNPMQSPEVQDKLKKASQRKFGVDNPFKSEICKQKARETNLQKRGATHHLQTKEGVEKMLATRTNNKIQKLLVEHGLKVLDAIRTPGEESDYIIRCPYPACSKCSEKKFTISSNILYDRLRWGTPLCTVSYQI